jgi:hypothetical protein
VTNQSFPERYAFTKAKQPEPGRLIRVQGHDWSPFWCEGKVTAYAKGGVRFLWKNPKTGGFEPEQNTWHDTETWEYADE